MPDKPVVVPLDGSAGAERAIPLARQVAEAWGSQVMFVHVVDDEVISNDESFRRARDAFARYASEVARREGLGAIDTEVRRGSPSREILKFAESTGAGCIVLGSHGRGGFRAAIIGSVADKVVRGAHLPVFVMPIASPTAVSLDPIVVGLDGSERAEAGLGIARDLAGALRAKLYLVRAYYFPTPATVEFGYYAPDLVEGVRAAAEEYLKEVARDGEETITALGPADSVLLEVGRQVDAGLIVLTSHGRGLAGRLALGSTTDRVMHASERALLIVPSHTDH